MGEEILREYTKILMPARHSFIAITMSESRYELLKCGSCGKTLGYMRLDVKMYPPKTLVRLTVGGPVLNVEKDVYCEECYRRLREARNEK